MSDRKPTPLRIDRLAFQFERLKANIENAREALEKPKLELIELATTWGAITRQARKSFRLDGVTRYILATYGVRGEVQKEAVQKLQLELVCLGRGRMFRELFRPAIQYVAVPGAAAAIRKAPREHRRHIIRLYRACFETKPLAPTVDVKKQKRETVAHRVRKATAAA